MDEAEPIEEERSSEEICASLKAQCKKIVEVFLECDASYRTFYKRTMEAADPIDTANLQPKEKLREWLTARGMNDPTLPFQTFFQGFLTEHKKDGLLDLSNRTVTLNEDARKLLGKRKTNAIPVLELIEKLSFLFE